MCWGLKGEALLPPLGNISAVGQTPEWNEGGCLGLRRVLFLIFKIHLYQIIWLSAILAFRFAFSRLHSSGLLHVTGSLANARLRPTKNLAPFHNFYKIVPLRSVFAPVEFSSKTLTSLINCYKQIQNWAVLALFYTRMQRLFTAWGIRPYFIRASFLRRSLTTSLYTRKLGRFLV